MSVPLGEVCQVQRRNCDGVPFQESVTSPQEFPDDNGVGGILGGVKNTEETGVLAALQHPVVLL
jgi:hypothetical protein